MTDEGRFDLGGLERPRLGILPPVGPNGAPGAGSGAPPPDIGYGSGYGSNAIGETEVHLLDYVKVLYKRRWTALTVFFIVVISVAVVTFTATPIYEAKVQILIEKENANVVSFKEAYEQNQIADDYYQTQYRILQSRTLARRTITALNLWNQPHVNPAPASGFAFSKLLNPIGVIRELLAPAKPAESPATDETKTQSRIIDAFLGQVTVAPIRNSRLVDVKVQSADPVMCTNIANALAKSYIEQNLEFKFMASKEASDWLGQRLTEQRKQVENSEQALQRYREQTEAISLEERQNIVVQKLADLNSAVTRAKTDRIQKETAYNQIRSIQNDRNSLDTFPAVISNNFIQQQKAEIADLQRQQAQLSEKLGPNHPDMLKISNAVHLAETKLRGEISKIVQSVKNEYQGAVIQEQNLTAALDQQKRDALALNRKNIDYGVLQRDAATNRQIFDSLLQRTKETGISGELRTSNIRVVDAAETPQRPVTPNKQYNMLLAFFGGAALAMGLAFFFEYIDNCIKTPDEIKQNLGLAFLGMVPALFDENTKNPLINNGVPNNFGESFRAIRTNVLFSSADAQRSVVVTSTGPGEGKTVVAGNLAIALAQAGQRVLLMDADMRKPRVHEIFDQPQQPGLSNVLVGNAKASESVRQTAVPGLWILPAGMHPPNPAELLGSKRFKDFMTSLTQHFDFVVIDSPPVMAVTDASVVAHIASGVLYVVGAEMTSRHAAQRGLEQLEHARAKFIGAVLNRVDLKHHAYYYSQYYSRKYSSYYQSAS